jgi:magnesium transporter
VVETASRADAAEIVQRHDFLSLPVVDPAGKLVGVVRVDDLLDAALDKVGAGILNQGGVAGKIAGAVPYFQTRIWKVVRSRLTWLVLLFVAETATGTVLRHFEDELKIVVELSFFVPLLIGTGGNAGSQTVSTIIRALALGEVRRKDVVRVLMKEIAAGLLLGVLLGVIAFFRALLWGVSYELAACVGTTVLAVCLWANSVGSMVPLLADALKIDPTVISAPFITTVVDATGLFIYFSIAHLMIGALHPSFPNDVSAICKPPEEARLFVADPSANPAWLEPRVKTDDGHALVKAIEDAPPAGRPALLDDAVKKAGLTSCPLADAWSGKVTDWK